MRNAVKKMVAPVLCALAMAVAAGSRAPVMGQSAEVRLTATLSPVSPAGGTGFAEFQAEAGKPTRFKAEVQGVRLPDQTLQVSLGGNSLSLSLVGGRGRIEVSGVVAAHAGDTVTVLSGATPILAGTLR